MTMSRRPVWRCSPALVLGWLIAGGDRKREVEAVQRSVNDRAELSSAADAIKRPARLIAEIKRDFNARTDRSKPIRAADRQKVRGDRRPTRGANRSSAKPGRRDDQDLEVKGIYVLICKQPAHIQVEVGKRPGRRRSPTTNATDSRVMLRQVQGSARKPKAEQQVARPGPDRSDGVRRRHAGQGAAVGQPS